MKVATYGALVGALLTISASEPALADSCRCIPEKQVAAPRTPRAARATYNDGLAYAQSGYNYRSSSRVSEVFSRADLGPNFAPSGYGGGYYDDGFRVAPNDAQISFGAPQAMYAPPYPSYPAPGIDVDDRGFDGGVGGGYAGGGGGGGGGGQAFVYLGGQGGGQSMPYNGGGVNLPPGYGPTYRGVWQGPAIPTRGGLSTGGGK